MSAIFLWHLGHFFSRLSGFAFIEFEDPRDAEDAVRDMDGRFVCGVRIRVEMAKSNSRYNENVCVLQHSLSSKFFPGQTGSERWRL